MSSPPFVAIDFETADRGGDSACAVSLVRVEGLRVVAHETRLLRPPRRSFVFTYVHGIRWQDVADAPTFAEAWPELAPLLDGASFLAAHNAPFDRGVLAACCAMAGLLPPPHRFECTVQIARRTWNVRPTTLPHVCRHLRIDLNHHDVASDALACARIMMAAQRLS
jgi:DNA polymerase-3 subunit epsilon